MDQYRIREILSGSCGTLTAGAVRGLLTPASWPYACAAKVRRLLYRVGILPSHSADRPVISVGNLTVGGTGKTPMVAWVVGQLVGAGAQPTILTRGYKTVAGVSEEAELLARLTGCPVIADGDRCSGAARAIADGADVLVMDDGFQHIRLRRDLDIVLVDATCPFGFGHCLPRGFLREPKSAVRAADAIVVTRSDMIPKDQLKLLEQKLKHLAPCSSLHHAIHGPSKLSNAAGRSMSIEDVAGRKVLAFCGVANSDPFFKLLENLGCEVLCRHSFDDHVAYTRQMVCSLRQSVSDCGAELAVTTAKDFIKVSGADLGKELWQLEVEMKVTEGRQELIDRIENSWHGRAQSATPQG